MPSDPGRDEDGGLLEARGDVPLPPDEVAGLLVSVYQGLLKAQGYAIALIRETEERSAPSEAGHLAREDLPLLVENERRYNDRLAFWRRVAELPEEA